MQKLFIVIMKYLDEVMSVYLKNDGGIMHSLSIVSFLTNRINMNNYVNEYFDYKYDSLHNKVNELVNENLLGYYQRKKQYPRLLCFMGIRQNRFIKPSKTIIEVSNIFLLFSGSDILTNRLCLWSLA